MECTCVFQSIILCFQQLVIFWQKKKNPCKSNPTRKCTSISPPITTDNVAHLDFDGNYHLALPDLYHDFSFRRAHVCVCVCVQPCQYCCCLPCSIEKGLLTEPGILCSPAVRVQAHVAIPGFLWTLGSEPRSLGL